MTRQQNENICFTSTLIALVTGMDTTPVAGIQLLATSTGMLTGTV